MQLKRRVNSAFIVLIAFIFFQIGTLTLTLSASPKNAAATGGAPASKETYTETTIDNIIKSNKDNLFHSETVNIINHQLEQSINMFINHTADYQTVKGILDSIKELGFSDKVENYENVLEQYHSSRQNYVEGTQYAEEKNYVEAISAYKKVLPADSSDYYSAQEGISRCLEDMRADYLKKASAYASNQEYSEAYALLSKISSFYPGDETLAQKISEYKERQMVVYHGPIEHIFFHPLIAYPQLAFDDDEKSKGYNDYFITVNEFNKIISDLYNNNFILVNIHSLYKEEKVNGKTVLTTKKLLLPQGKKPLILSIDDLNYYDYMRRNGNVYKLILDSDGNTAAYSVSPEGKEMISYDNEIIPILDSFVQKHPDFSLDGAKGIIALTGYEGILGYRTSESDSPSYETEKKEVLPVINHLKETGWTFASHGYGHLNAREISLKTLSRDTQHWLKEVEPLIGHTDVYIYPFGSSVLPGDPKFKYLLDSGFHVLCSVGPYPYFKAGPDYIMMDRRHIDGISLYYQGASLKSLFDSRKVIDPIRPPFNP